MTRRDLAQETLDILMDGSYPYDGEKVSIAKLHQKSLKNTMLISAKEANEIRKKSFSQRYDTNYSIANESATVSVIHLQHEENLGILNFASAVNPGGGFTTGAVAQEEDLAISSGLYATQLKHPEYYEINQLFQSPLYTDTAIFSPDVVYFRDGNLELLPAPLTASTLTLPAVNFGEVLRTGGSAAEAQKVMYRRMEIVLALFAHEQMESIILGAYGAGVFRNDPRDIANWWKALFSSKYKGVFRTVHFAVYDRSPALHNYQLFSRMVQELSFEH